MATPQPNLQRLGEAASRASSVKIGWNHAPTGFSAPSLLRTRLGARPAAEFEILSTEPGEDIPSILS